MRRGAAALVKSLGLSGLFAGLLLAFDGLAYMRGAVYPSEPLGAFVPAMFLGGMCLAGMRAWHAVAVFTLLLVMTVTGMLYKVYFGAPLTPEILFSVLTHMGSLHADIVESLADEQGLWLVTLLAAVAAFAAYVFAARRLCMRPRLWAYAGAFLVFVAAPVFHIEHNGVSSPMIQPSAVRPIVQNSLYTFYATALRLRTLSEAKAQEAHYKISRGKPLARNIVLIMGESCRFDRMSLFGWPEPTTPRLDALKAAGALRTARGYSASTTTRDSLRVFFNLLYSPEQSYFQPQSNLFDLARQQGYKTFLISTQLRKTVADMQAGPVDGFLSRDEMDAGQVAQGDDLLFTILNELPLGERNFIVLHQRSMHSPYDAYYQPALALYPPEQIAQAKDRAARVAMQYANAMRYNDYVLGQIIKTVRAHPVLARDTTLLFTSDHAEYLGEGGRFGHGHGTLENAAVPYVISEVNVPQPRAQALLRHPVVSYYDAAEWLAGLMGIAIDNPYREPGRYYLHGSGTLSEYSAIRYEMQPDGQVTEEHLSPAAEWVRETTGFK